VDPLCLSCFEVLVDSPFLQNLNTPNDTVPGVQYHFISSKDDELVTPYTNGFLLDAATNPLAQNIVLQDLCAFDISDHIAQMSDPIAFNSIAAFFDPSEDQIINCLDGLM
jgi:triacylglycerol lipase